MINSLGLIFFIPMINYETNKGIICFTVLMNGLLCHITRTLKTSGWKNIRNYDILCNVIMGLYIIYQTHVVQIFLVHPHSA